MLNVSIRRAAVISGLVLGATTLLASNAMADTVGVGGTVAQVLHLATTATSGASTLSLNKAASATAQIVKVADLKIDTNNEQGYTLTVTSGNLTKAGGTDIPFQVTTTAAGVTATTFSTTSGSAYTYGTSAANEPDSGDRDLSIKYQPASLQDPGDYAASITVTVAAN